MYKVEIIFNHNEDHSTMYVDTYNELVGVLTVFMDDEEITDITISRD